MLWTECLEDRENVIHALYHLTVVTLPLCYNCTSSRLAAPKLSQRCWKIGFPYFFCGVKRGMLLPAPSAFLLARLPRLSIHTYSVVLGLIQLTLHGLSSPSCIEAPPRESAPPNEI